MPTPTGQPDDRGHRAGELQQIAGLGPCVVEAGERDHAAG